MNIQSITVVLTDGTIWTAEASSFTQVTPPIQDKIVEVDVKTESGTETVFVPEAVS